MTLDRMEASVRRALRRSLPLRRLLRDVVRAISEAGGAVYLVGGYLRDIAEGKETGDVDLLVTSLTHRRTGDVLRSLYLHATGVRKVVAAGKRFPVHRVAVDGIAGYIDISTVRGGAPARVKRSTPRSPRDDRPGVEDASQRDFTINSFLFRLLAAERGAVDGYLLDPFGGLDDLRRKRIRCVGTPEDRFHEDPLRILRGIRLKNERPGYAFHRDTGSAIRRLGAILLPSVSPDRLAVELVRSLSADPVGTIGDLRRHGLLRILLPQSGKRGSRIPERIERRFRLLRRSLGTPLPTPLLLGNLLADLRPEDALRTARGLRLPGIRGIASVLFRLDRLAHPEALRFPMSEIESVLAGAEDPEGLIALYRAVRRASGMRVKDYSRFLGRCNRTPRWVTGDYLEKIGVPGGEVRKEILLLIREKSLAGKIRRRAEAERMARAMHQTAGG